MWVFPHVADDFAVFKVFGVCGDRIVTLKKAKAAAIKSDLIDVRLPTQETYDIPLINLLPVFVF